MNLTAGTKIEEWTDQITTLLAYTSSNVSGSTIRTSAPLDSRRSLYGIECTPASTFIAVGQGGWILRSTDKAPQNYSSWSSRPSNTTKDLFSVSYNGFSQVFVAVGAAGTILTSSDNGTTWTARTSGTTYDLNHVCFAGNKFIAVGNSGTILMSTTTSGVDWVKVTDTKTTKNLFGVCFANNRITAVGDDLTIVVSTDAGATWVNRTPYSSTNSLSAVAASTATDGLILATVKNGYNFYFTSTDGVTWSIRSNIPGANFYFTTVKYVNHAVTNGFEGFVLGGYNSSKQGVQSVSRGSYFPTVSWELVGTSGGPVSAIAANTGVTGVNPDYMRIVSVGSPVMLKNIPGGYGVSITPVNNNDLISRGSIFPNSVFCSWDADYLSIRSETSITLTFPAIAAQYNAGSGKKSNGYYSVQAGINQYTLVNHNLGYTPAYIVFDVTNNRVINTSTTDIYDSTTIRQFTASSNSTSITLYVNHVLYTSTLPERTITFKIAVLDQGLTDSTFRNSQPEVFKISADRIILGNGKLDTNRNYVVKSNYGNQLTVAPHLNINMGKPSDANPKDTGSLWVYKDGNQIASFGDTNITGDKALWWRDYDQFTGQTKFIKKPAD